MRPLVATAAVLTAGCLLDAGLCASSSPQHPLLRQQDVSEHRNALQASRKLHGKFLHITDIHPDPFYKADSDIDERCHRGRGDAGYLGSETSACDSPWSLVNETFRWIKDNLKDEIDFVVWTGDSARHDSDSNIPRSSAQIYELNQQVADKFVEVFGTKENLDDDDPANDLIIPIVPSMGNNDIFPHNIMEAGPSKTTREFLHIWKPFIPEDQYHVFQRGAYWWQQVVPGTHGEFGNEGGLAVFSLNTMYFFSSNSAVDGCDAKSEPGYEQMEWLKIQLDVMRARKMKAILIGHVPPAWTEAKESWDQSCWRKYALWSRQYRDVIVGALYGHMNLDHFILLDGKELKPPGDIGKKHKRRKTAKSSIPAFFDNVIHLFRGTSTDEDVCAVAEFDPESDPDTSVLSAENYLESLRDMFSHIFTPVPSESTESAHKELMKRIGGKYAERYVLSLVGPSVIPNYFPTLRVFEYNTTGLVNTDGYTKVGKEAKDDIERDNTVEGAKKKKGKKPDIPDPPDKTLPPGPAYSPQTYTWLGYTQYFTNLTTFNAEARRKANHGDNGEVGRELKRDIDIDMNAAADRDRLEYEVEYNTRTDKIYKLEDMTVRSYIKLAKKIVDASANFTTHSADEVITGLDNAADDVDFWFDDEQEMPDSDDDNESGNDSENNPDDSDSDDDMETETNCKKKKNKDKKKCKKRKHWKKKKDKKRDRVWHTFVTRAFVGTVNGDDLDAYSVRNQETCIATKGHGL